MRVDELGATRMTAAPPGAAAARSPDAVSPERAPGTSEGRTPREDVAPRPSVVEVIDLTKVYPGNRKRPPVRALDGVTFSVREGEFFGFLGPNGAGKTTTIRVLATLSKATSGRAAVAGLDVARQAGEIRRRIGLAMQTVALENLLTGRENLELIGRLHRIEANALRRRIDDLLELINLTEAASRLVGTYSGGMRRRLDLATALVHRPDVLFLDEPTEGLDPQSRRAFWDELLRINRAGTTMFLTTHYMEEADRLCDRLAIVDDGRIIIEGTPAALKRSVGADTVEIALGDPNDGRSADASQQAADALAVLGEVRAAADSDTIEVAIPDARAAAPEILRRLDAVGITVRGVAIREPTLDDVFLRYCGHRIRAEEANEPLNTGWFG